MNDREITLRRAILEELDNTPRSYLQPDRALRASLRLSVCPPPSDAETTDALRRLEAEAMLHCEVDALGALKWCITGVGRAALKEA